MNKNSQFSEVSMDLEPYLNWSLHDRWYHLISNYADSFSPEMSNLNDESL